MIIEIARMTITDGDGEKFEAAVVEAVSVFRRAKGCLGLSLQKCIEYPNEYDVVIHWETLENHTVDFREGEIFKEWRALVGPFFAKPPEVRHLTLQMPHVGF